jgi:hypothetical protein
MSNTSSPVLSPLAQAALDAVRALSASFTFPTVSKEGQVMIRGLHNDRFPFAACAFVGMEYITGCGTTPEEAFAAFNQKVSRASKTDGGKLAAVRAAIDGYIDGAPDAPPASKLANEISNIIN